MAIQISGSTVIHDSQDVQVSGVVTATSFHGDASQLTNLPAAGSSLEATASGTLSDGSTVIVNTDGTVSVAAQTGSASPSVGSEVTYNSNGSTTYNSAAYDSSTGKVVISYRDQGNSNYGTAVVGTVSGTSISFGTPVVFESASIYFTSTAYDSTNQKVIIAYSDNGNNQYGTAIVGTVSGTSISFGSPVVFESATSNSIVSTYDSSNGKVVIAYQDAGNSFYGTAVVGTVSGTSISFGSPTLFESTGSASYISATFDSSNGKVVIAYANWGNSGYGTAIVGTVSGTSISFGSKGVFNTAATYWISATFDSSNNKVVIAYYDGGNNNYGTAIVGTVSGTSISFGSEVVFESATTREIKATFDSSNGKVVIAYSDGGNSDYGTAIVGTVSGTSISFGSPVIFNTHTIYNATITFDSTNNRSVIAYRDLGNSQYGTAAVFATNTLSTNLTAENFIGISDGAYSDGQTATIQLIGSVDDAQSGLTPGQKYYVQSDGSLSTTADTPSVLAGKAISSTKLAIKG